MDGLYVIADDLTGACDVGASFVPWTGGVAVAPGVQTLRGTWPGLVVFNTQSRTVAQAVACGAVARALASAAVGPGDVVFKKIDTGLRGHLGAELDVVMDAVGAAEAFVVPAIPEVGRTTVDGVQHADGVPVHETPFGRDPQNPITDSSVARVIMATSRRRASSLPLATVRAPATLAAVIDDRRRRGDVIFVCDAETDLDLRGVAGVLVGRARPLVLVGSTGLARAVRAQMPAGSEAPSTHGRAEGDRGAGVLIVAGSGHPTAWAQLDWAARHRALEVFLVDSAAGDALGAAVAARLRAGANVALAAPRTDHPGGSAAVLRALADAALVALEAASPRGMVLVGGETAFGVLDGLGGPLLGIEGRVAPLAVRARVATGRLTGLPVVTKGGSTGPVALIADIVGSM